MIGTAAKIVHDRIAVHKPLDVYEPTVRIDISVGVLTYSRNKASSLIGLPQRADLVEQ